MNGDERVLLEISEVHKLLLEMLAEFDSVCREHGIRYTLDYGTLLGAVRHRGFIPWDDDIDVSVPRPDFEKLLSHPEWFESFYKIRPPLSDLNPFPFAKLFDLRWRAQEPIKESVLDEYLWIDIFPLDSVPEDDVQLLALIDEWKSDSVRARRSVQNIDAVTESKAKRMVKKVVYPLHSLVFPYRRIYSRMYDRSQALPFGSTKRVANVVWPSYRKEIWMDLTNFDSLIELEFQGLTCLSIPSWHDHLAAIYGEYLVLPPEEKRMSHHIKVWAS